MEIGLYYLQSRYYDPEVGRFINLDETSIAAATTGEILGTNLFAYCFNNPINYIDYNGYETEYGINFDPRRPNLWGNDDYKYDKNAIAGKKDKSNWNLYTTLVKASVLALPNGSKFFEHYLYGKGKSLYYNYNYAINYDKGIRNTIEYEIMTMAGYVEKYKAKTDYWIIGSNYFAVYPSTLDWMFSLGTHLALIIGQVFFNQKTSKYEVCVMIEAYDLYNFSKTKKFLGVKVKTPGRFQELGWANAYESFGFAMYKVTWKAGFYMSTNKRIDCTPYIK